MTRSSQPEGKKQTTRPDDDGALRVAALMTRNVLTALPSTPVLEIVRLFHDRGIRHLPIVDGVGTLLGLISQRDLLRFSPRTHSSPREATAGQFMTPHPTVTAPEGLAADAARELLSSKRSCLPVIHDKVLVGILTEADFVRHFLGTPASGKELAP